MISSYFYKECLLELYNIGTKPNSKYLEHSLAVKNFIGFLKTKFLIMNM